MKYLTLTIPGESGGQTISAPGNIPTGGLGETSVILRNAIALVLATTGFLAIVFIIWAGIGFILSGGDKTKIQAARNKLTYAIVGLVLTLLSFLIVMIIQFLFGVKLLSTF